MSNRSLSLTERRSFFTRLNAGLISFAAMAGVARAQQKPGVAVRWEPALHEKDDWLDKVPSKHRLVFDTTTPEGFGEALAFAGNFVRVNRTDYGVESSDLAVVIVARHRSTAFGYNDAMWAKYGPSLAARSKAEDPKTKQAPKVNLYGAEGYDETLLNRGVTVDSLAKLGVQFAICSVSTRGNAGEIAEAVGRDVNAIFKELTANLVSSARMVPAGIVAVNRAQEHGYSLVTT